MTIKGFRVKKFAEDYQKEHGGEILWLEWSRKRAIVTEKGKRYQKVMQKAGLDTLSDDYRYIVVN